MFPAKEKTLNDDDEDDDDDNFVDDDDDNDDEDDDVDNFVYDDNGKPSTTCFPATEKNTGQENSRNRLLDFAKS